jgi:hypothetical protein
MRFVILVMIVFLFSCAIDHYGTGLPDALKKVTPPNDTVCIEEEYDWFHHTKPVHIHCIHEKPKP